MKARVQWYEFRDRIPYAVIADWNGSAWEFFDREAYELRWFKMEPTSRLVEKAHLLLASGDRPVG